jgi:CRISPR/Cas system-associated endonuclease Cas3-HD
MNDPNRTVFRLGTIAVVVVSFLGLAAMHWNAVRQIGALSRQALLLDANETLVRAEALAKIREIGLTNREIIIDNTMMLRESQKTLEDIQAAMSKVKSDLATFNTATK